MHVLASDGSQTTRNTYLNLVNVNDTEGRWTVRLPDSHGSDGSDSLPCGLTRSRYLSPRCLNSLGPQMLFRTLRVWSPETSIESMQEKSVNPVLRLQ